MTTETDRIVRLLEKTFDKHPWYGSSILEVLAMDSAIAARRIGNGHTIIELVRHMISWRIFATKRLQGDHAFEVTEQMNFPAVGTWDDVLSDLRNSQTDLIKVASIFPENRLGELVPSNTQKYTYYTLLHGIIHHDIYHLGQIAYIRKSLS